MSSAFPFGLSRMQPFPETSAAPYQRVVLDDDSQTARYLDADGNQIPSWDKHRESGTSRETSTDTGDMAGRSDQGHDQAGDTD